MSRIPLQFRRCCILAVLLISGFAARPQSAFAQTAISTLFSTGVDASGTPLPGGAIDPHYMMIVSPDSFYTGPAAYVVNDVYPVAPYGPWVANSALSKWIGPNADQDVNTASGGDYTYRTTFDLSGFNPAGARITGLWAADDSGLEILLNGVSMGVFGNPTYTDYAPFSLSNGFVTGVNTLDFRLRNYGGPTALRVEMSGTVVPEGSALVSLLTGLGGIGLVGMRLRARR